MSVDIKEVERLVIEVANKVMNELPEEERRAVNEKSSLLGGDSVFDSLNFVTFILDLEQAINRTKNVSITLADERAMSQPSNPFQAVSTLSSYIKMLLNERLPTGSNV
jgi:hypothetical protein